QLLATVQPDVAEAFAPCRRREPGAEALRVADAAEVLDQAQPDRLRDVGRVGTREAVRAGRRPDKALEALDELVPGGLVAGGGCAYECVEIHLRPFRLEVGEQDPRPWMSDWVAMDARQCLPRLRGGHAAGAGGHVRGDGAGDLGCGERRAVPRCPRIGE